MWLFAVLGSAVLGLPVVSTGLVVVERQSARCTPRLWLARAVTYVALVGCSVLVLAGPHPTSSVVTVAAAAGSVGLVLAAGTGDAAVVVLLAIGLVVVFCSTQPWFVEAVTRLDRHPSGAVVPVLVLVLAAAVPARVAVRPSSGLR